jgi:long-chain acyl-CoA synthetase
LREAHAQWADETCLIEANRDREVQRMTYGQFAGRGATLASALQEAGFEEADRAAIIMTNQTAWLLSAYAVFHCGGVLVPLDYKLTGDEHWKLLEHSKANTLVVEYPFWRALMQAPGYASHRLRTVWVVEAPTNADLGIARRWEECASAKPPQFVERQRRDVACIVYSSGTGGRPKGCVLLHDNYLEQCAALTQLYSFWPGVRYLSVLPTNHAIDFMVGFLGPFFCGATVVHLRTLRPEFVRDAFTRYKITYMALVPMVLKNLEKGLRQRIDDLPPLRRRMFNVLRWLNRAVLRGRPKLAVSRVLLRPIHDAFGGELRTLFVGGAFTEPATLDFFFDLGIPVANGYGLTEAGTVITVNDMNPFRADTVGKPLPGTQVVILDADENGIGEVLASGRTIMSHYLDDAELTQQTIIDGWLHTGDQGRIDASGHLQLMGRKKNMIVTEGGKNIYPEDIENAFVGIPVKEFCVFAANYLWSKQTLVGEELVMILRLEPDQTKDSATHAMLRQALDGCNRRLPDFKRVHRYLVWDEDFPRTASMKIKRNELADAIRARQASEAEAVAL